MAAKLIIIGHHVCLAVKQALPSPPCSRARRMVRRLYPPKFLIFLPHFRLYEVVWLHMCFIPYEYRKISEMLLELMKLCDIMGSRCGGQCRQRRCIGHGPHHGTAATSQGEGPTR